MKNALDRLYTEYVLGRMAVKVDGQGDETVIYESGEDLLKRTPSFYENQVENRLNKLFNKVYTFEIAHFEGEKYYINGMGRNQDRLSNELKAGDFSMLRRRPPENHGSRHFPDLETYLNQHPQLKTKKRVI